MFKNEYRKKKKKVYLFIHLEIIEKMKYMEIYLFLLFFLLEVFSLNKQ